jgi:hypothetical protein
VDAMSVLLVMDVMVVVILALPAKDVMIFVMGVINDNSRKNCR